MHIPIHSWHCFWWEAGHPFRSRPATLSGGKPATSRPVTGIGGRPRSESILRRIPGGHREPPALVAYNSLYEIPSLQDLCLDLGPGTDARHCRDPRERRTSRDRRTPGTCGSRRRSPRARRPRAWLHASFSFLWLPRELVLPRPTDHSCGDSSRFPGRGSVQACCAAVGLLAFDRSSSSSLTAILGAARSSASLRTGRSGPVGFPTPTVRAGRPRPADRLPTTRLGRPSD